MNLIASTATQRVPVHVSTMSGKLAGIPAINTNTLSNKFCRVMSQAHKGIICSSCYSVSMLSTFRKMCVPSFERNSETLSHGIIEDWQIPRFNTVYARFSGHGEIINETHAVNLFRIAQANPQTTFGWWTKRKDVIRKALRIVGGKPANVILVYSNAHIDKPMTKPPAGFDKVFNNVSDSYEGDINCTGKCMDCLACYRHGTTNVIVERVK